MAAADDGKNTTSGAAASSGNATKKRPLRVTYAPDFSGSPIYADGVHGVMVSAGVAHIDLYQVIMPGNEKQKQPEQRVVSHRLVLPLSVLGEMGGIINSMRQALVKNAGQQAATVKK